jgi:hypothetical protein
MTFFWQGFEKRSEEKSKLQKAAPFLLAGAAGLGLGALGTQKFLKSNFHYRGAPGTEGLINKLRGAISGYAEARPHSMASTFQTAAGPIRGAPDLSKYDYLNKTWSAGGLKDTMTETGKHLFDNDPPRLLRAGDKGWEHIQKSLAPNYRDNANRQSVMTTKALFAQKPSQKAIRRAGEDANILAEAVGELKAKGWEANADG